MVIQQIFIFIIFLGPLIFFHELGHFLFAKFFGVKVEVFSIGFGPKILKFKRGETEYALSLIPLGGYVKMFGDDPNNKDAVSEELQNRSFLHKPKWARFWIVFGGPLANFILAFFLYFALVLTGEKVPELRMGVVDQTSLLYKAGIRTGDILSGVNGQPISAHEDFESINGIISSIELIRGETKINLTGLSYNPESFLLDFSRTPFMLRKPFLVDNKGNYFAISNDVQNINSNISLEEWFEIDKANYLIPISILENEVKKNGDAIDIKNSSLDLLIKSQIYFPIDLSVLSIVMGSPADKAGLKKGDVVSEINSEKIKGFDELRKKLQTIGKSEIGLTYFRNGLKQEVKLSPEEKIQGEERTFTIGVWSSIQLLAPKLVEAEGQGLAKAFPLAFKRTFKGIERTLDGFKKLITSEASVKNLGGPLAIGKVAADSINISLSYFFRLMALISINLGIINLFPIPVLDGGHIMFLVLEFFNRGPLSKKKMEVAQQFGVSLLLLMIFVALYNDISRFF